VVNSAHQYHIYYETFFLEMGNALFKFPVEFSTAIPVVHTISHIDIPQMEGIYFLRVYYLLNCCSFFICIRESVTPRCKYSLRNVSYFAKFLDLRCSVVEISCLRGCYAAQCGSW